MSAAEEHEANSDGAAALFKFDELELTVASQRILRSAADLDKDMLSQLSFLVDSPNYWWLDSIEDCFNKRQVDDGILIYKQLQSTELTLYYWLGYFGGNPRGYVLMPASSNGKYNVLIENCDTDFIWRGQEEQVPKTFIKQVKMCAYGDKYREEEDDE